MEYGSTKNLIQKEIFQSENIERRKITSDPWVMFKNTETRNDDKKPLHNTKLQTNCHWKKHRPQSEPSYRRQVLVHPRHQTPQGEPVAKLETFLLIILSLICEFHIQKAHYILSIPLFKKNVSGQNIQVSWINVETVYQTLIISNT